MRGYHLEAAKPGAGELQAGVIYAGAVWGKLQPTPVPHKLWMYLLGNSYGVGSGFFWLMNHALNFYSTYIDSNVSFWPHLSFYIISKLCLNLQLRMFLDFPHNRTIP